MITQEKEQLQRLLDKVELDCLSLGGNMKLGYGFRGNPSENEMKLGDILDTVLEVKRLLGLTTNLKKVMPDD